MTQVLGKITAPELEGPSGPDVSHRIEVPEAWFEEGVMVAVELPQRLACARCEGGGCDACGRSGAVAVWSNDEEPCVVSVGLPRPPRPGAAVVLRVPEAGAPHRATPPASDGAPAEGAAAETDSAGGREPELSAPSDVSAPVTGHRGALFLRVSTAPTPSAGVRRAYGVQSAADLSNEERRRLVQRSAALIGGLIVTFLVLLWLSGWL